MEQLVRKYVGEQVEIIYIDRAGSITQRHIEVHGIRCGLVRAKCLRSGQPRAFRVDRILAVQPVLGKKSASGFSK
ncbi:hypothetical protein [Paenibacillus sp. J22TS3]|uniref:hypothetical protein n=1 Tax=Paenibacillus sp. J22TS3 TaxID=2807192 RepID=UPI001B210C37|nr:hypothetical protein [Paenibacillus sp. J22TS3]GIP22673.1 hypothetical protein J22TS3_29480 [Paenibacillus sp. J22TS3]